MNQWVLVTGASAGIGRELAKLFARDGYNLVLHGRNESRLNELSGELRQKNQIQTRVLAKDLAAPTAAAEIFDSLRETPISILVNNAGFGLHGPFAENNLTPQTEILQVNMTALVQLTHLFLQPMLARRDGRILNVASTAAFQPGPTMSIYYASKAFVYSFSYALADELAQSGVSVTVLCPGTTRTEFFERARLPVSSRWPMMDAARVAEIGYRGLMRRERVVIPGTMNRITSFLAKLAPTRLVVKAVRKIHEQH